MIVSAVNLNSLWVQLLDTLLNRGAPSSPRGEKTFEVIPLRLTLATPLHNILTIPERNLNYSFMVAEWFWIMAGRDDVASIAHYNKEIARFSDDGERYFGAYGPKVLGQRDYVLRKLTEDLDSRQAVINIWRENPPGTRDVPCTIALQFLLRENALTLIVTMRSSDAWLGVPYDLFNFSRIQSWFARRLHAREGALHVNLGSSHLYEPHFSAAREIVDRYKKPFAFDDLPAGKSPPLVVAHDADFIRRVEERARLTGTVDEETTGAWRDYAEALAYRYWFKRGHTEPRGDSHIMKIIRAAREARRS